MTPTTHALSSAQLADYDRDGFLVLPDLYPAQQMSDWKRIVQEEAKKKPAAGPSDSGVHLWRGYELHPVLKAAMGDDVVLPILLQIIGPDVEFLSVKAVYKDGRTRFASPFHQDWFYWEGATKVSIWIALDDATPANGCLTFIPGTHKRVFNRIDQPGVGFALRIAQKDLEGLPVRTIEVKRGDAVIFHDLAVHGSHPITSGQDRWSLISTYRNAAVEDPTGLKANLWNRPLLLAGRSVNGGEQY